MSVDKVKRSARGKSIGCEPDLCGGHSNLRMPPALLQDQRLTTHHISQNLSWLRLRFYSRLRFHLGQALSREKNDCWSHMFLMCSAYRASKPFADGLGTIGRQLVRTYPDWQCLLTIPPEELTDQLATWSHNRP